MDLQRDRSPEPRDLLEFIFFNQTGLRSGWRVLIFAVMVLILELMVGLIAPLLAPGLLRASSTGYISPFDLLLVRLLHFLSVVLATWIMGRIEGRTLGEYGLPLRNHPVLNRFVRGYLFWGFLPLSLLLLMMRGLRVFYFGRSALSGFSVLYWALIWGLVFLAVAFWEEYLFRGYALKTLAEGIGFWPAAVVLASLFTLGHASNPGETRIGLVMTAFFAMFVSVTLWRTGSLWLSVGAHAGWDWAQSYFYGVSDSGLQVQGHLFNPHVQGPEWLSGGSVGPEGSVLTLVLLIVMSALFARLYSKRRDPALVITTIRGDFHGRA